MRTWSSTSTGRESAPEPNDCSGSGTHAAVSGAGLSLGSGLRDPWAASSHAGARSGRSVGEHVFVPGHAASVEVRGLFGGAAAKVVVPAGRVTPIDERMGEQGVLLALAATAYHALCAQHAVPADLIVGHGVLGRLIARLAC